MSTAFHGSRIYECRLQAGDDASCLNLYQPQRPQVLGVSAELIARGGFAWAAPKREHRQSVDLARRTTERS